VVVARQDRRAETSSDLVPDSPEAGGSNEWVVVAREDSRAEISSGLAPGLPADHPHRLAILDSMPRGKTFETVFC